MPYADLASEEGLEEIADYADGVGVCKDVMIPRDAGGFLTMPANVIDDPHDADPHVHGWTCRRENHFFPTEYRSGADLEAPGHLAGEPHVFLAAGMDGFFTDNPDIGAMVASELSDRRR